MSSPQDIPEVAFYYPDPMWRNSDWVKNLILFFDGIALLVPEYMRDRPAYMDPAVVEGLQEHGLLHILVPERVVDKQATNALVSAMADVLDSGALDSLSGDKSAFAEISYSRLGFFGDERLAYALLAELESRKLAARSEDGVSVPVHRMVRSLILTLLAQILRARVSSPEMTLAPATDQDVLVSALEELLGASVAPSKGHVVSFDLATVGADMSSVPIADILAYRNENREAYSAYAKSIRRFTWEVSAAPSEEVPQLWRERQSELHELANGLSRRSWQAWQTPTSIALTAAGVASDALTGDALGIALTAAGIGVGLTAPRPQASPLSYLFKVPRS